ncbi:Gfo/Idh/MocA family protein [Enterococcus sp. LJL98]
MKIGIIGYGNIAKRFFQSIQHTDEGKVTAIASKSLFKNKEFQSAYPHIQVYESYETLLTEGDIDGVYIALPHKDHKEWALKALDLKIPVLCEKPAVLTTLDMDEIILSAQKNETLFMEAFKTKFNDGFMALKEDIQQLGALKKISASFCFDDVEARDANSYLVQKDQGGALNDVGTYSIGFVLALIDAPIIQIKADKEYLFDVDGYFSANLTFGNGLETFVEGAIDREKERVARIIGEKGEITIPFFYRMETYELQLLGQAKIQKNYPVVGDEMTLEIQHFIDHFKAKESTCATHSLKDTRKILAVMEGIRQG